MPADLGPARDASGDGRIVLITGCSSGIGLESAVRCARQGHTVYATVRSMAKSDKLLERISSEKLENVRVIEMDVSSESSIEAALSEIIRNAGRIDVLFNNAGFMILGSLEDLTLNEIKSQVDTDLMGPIYLTKSVIPHMRGDVRGLIINMSSVAGKIGFGLSSAYCVSKFGIEGFTESLRRELGPRNIDVCLIEAGIVNTDFFDNMRQARSSHGSPYARETEEMKSLIDRIKVGNWTEPADVADLVAGLILQERIECRYVVGPDARYMIDSLYHHRGDCEKMDLDIQEIMSQYSGQDDPD